jgi:hypothetical protein
VAASSVVVIEKGVTVNAWDHAEGDAGHFTGFGIAVLVQFAATLSMIAVWLVWVITG